ncbi:ABC transporter permease [Romboutsia weinsteinii]|uniref:ABC transporter permease n=1 Tax=Romboutsia weinsteinii TaxID=2020949 RepID=A0A371J7Q4_9FIRM|nr:ABC transporter permease [Romboutsia weinsteinii]RDY28784.1 ABC transporter permease [Romboutsia weinsteinii]
MRLFATIKMLFKSIKNTFLLNIVYFIALPLGLAWFMGLVLDSEFNNPIETETTPIVITNNDNSAMSNNLSEFLKEDLSSIVSIVDNEKDADIEIIIPNDYEKNLLSSQACSIDIKELNTKSGIINILQNILDDYHENVYLNSIASSTEVNEIFNKYSLKTSYLEANNTPDSYEYFATSFIVFLVLMFIMNNTAGSYLGESNGLNKRTFSLPISRLSALCYDCIGSSIYSFLFLMLYVIVYRLLNISFDGNFIILTTLCLVSSLLISSCSSFISTFFSKKIGSTVFYIIMILQMIFGGMFIPIDMTSKWIKISPFYLVNDMFSSFNEYNNWESIATSSLICVILSLILFVASAIKEKYSWREF